MDPSAVVKEVADELKEKAEEAGIDAADAFIDTLEGIKDKAKEGAGDIAGKVMGAAGEFKSMLEEALADPSKLAPGGVGGCASWYGNEVVKKLKELGEKVGKIVDLLKAMIDGVGGPMKELAKTMADAMAGITKTVKGLTSLPKTLEALQDKVKGPDDIKDVPTEDMLKALDMSGLNGPLDSLKGLNKTLASAGQAVADTVMALADFLGEAPDLIRGAFAPPFPLCFANSMLMAQAPPLFQELLSKVDALKELDLQVVVDMVKQIEDTLGNLDPEVVTQPLNKFAESAKGSIEKLDTAKKAAGLGSLKPPGGHHMPHMPKW